MAEGLKPAARHRASLGFKATVVLGLPTAGLIRGEIWRHAEAFKDGYHAFEHVGKEVLTETGDEELYVHVGMLPDNRMTPGVSQER